MNFTEKQRKYVNDLLEKLNFNADHFRENYLELLKYSYKNFKSIGNCEKAEIIYNNTKRGIPKNGIFKVKYVDKGSLFEIHKFSLFDFLKLEVNIKRKKLYTIKQVTDFKGVTATDIANYTFCPVSFSISRSLFYKTLESTDIGDEKHQDSIIYSILKENKSFKFSQKQEDEKSEIQLNENYIQLNKILSDFEIIFSGHSNDDKEKIFQNSKGNYFGQPDFILKNILTHEIIVIEEKYQFIPKPFNSYGNSNYYNQLEDTVEAKRNNIIFYDNHINQIGSYLYGISEYEISYGILIYWKYEIEENKKIVKKCIFKKIYKNEELKFALNEIYKKIILFKKIKKIEYDIKTRKPAKCASCVNNFLCGHKTGKFNMLQFPYNPECLKLNDSNALQNSDFSNNGNEKNYIEIILENIVNDEPPSLEEITA